MAIHEFDNDSWITHIKYDDELRLMWITMKSGQKNVYECEDVPMETYEGIRDAPSRGSYFNEHIKGQFMHKWFKSEE